VEDPNLGQNAMLKSKKRGASIFLGGRWLQGGSWVVKYVSLKQYIH